MSELLRNIQAQPDSLRGVIESQFGAGRSVITEAAKFIRSADNVIFTGMGSSLFACIPAAQLLVQRGVRASAVDSAELLYYETSLCRPRTLVIVVTRSGETVEAVKLLPALRSSGCHIIGVTNEPQSTIAKETAPCILVGSKGDQLVALQSYTGTVAALLVLAEAATAEEFDRIRTGLTDTAGQMSTAIADALEGVPMEAVAKAPAIYLLGRGPSLASVREGALLFNESARTPSVGMGSAQFRHGSVEVMNPSFFAFVFATHPTTSDLDRSLAADILAMGGNALGIGPGPGKAFTLPWRGESLDPIFAPLLEIVPVQVSAWRLAESKGIVAGNFQFAPLVTDTETGFDTPARLPSS